MPNLFCPVCKTTYQDESLSFCLNDGTKLVALGNNSQETVQMPFPVNPSSVNNSSSEPTFQIQSPAQTTEIKSRKNTGLIIGLLTAGFLVILAIGGAIGAYYVFSAKSEIAATTPTPQTTPSPNNTNESAKSKELEEKLKRLEKQLEEQKRISKTNSTSTVQPQEQTGTATAKVNSPNDGFLALRSAPSTETGTQIIKIPHGATVVLNNCEKNTIKVSGRNGRWCQVEYADNYGWVFSAWLDY